MTITQHISIDLQQPGNMPMVHAVQGDEYTRKIEIELYSNGASWNPPDGCEVAIRYGKPDGKGGIYDVLPDNTPAYSIEGNAITVTLAPQMLTVPGVVEVQASIIKDRKDRLSTFSFAVDVAADPSKGELKSEKYVNWKSYYIPQTTGASVGQYLKITEVDADGRVTAVEAVDVTSGGGSDTPGEDVFSPVATVEQTENGAVITITDRSGTTTATVANGKDGADGYTPVKGTDYFTEADKAELVEAVAAEAGSGTLSADEKDLILSIFEKVAYQEGASEALDRLKNLWGTGYKNWIPYSTESDGVTIYNGGLGYKTGYRMSSSGSEKELSDALVVGFIPCKAGDVLRFAVKSGKTVSMWRDLAAVSSSLVAYDSSKTVLGQFSAQPAGYGIFKDEIEVDKMVKNGDVWEYTVMNNADIAFVRITLPYVAGSVGGDDYIITINQEIK